MSQLHAVPSGQPHTTGLHVVDVGRDRYECFVEISGSFLQAVGADTDRAQDAIAREFQQVILDVLRQRRRDTGLPKHLNFLRELNGCTLTITDESSHLVDSDLFLLQFTFPK